MQANESFSDMMDGSYCQRVFLFLNVQSDVLRKIVFF